MLLKEAGSLGMEADGTCLAVTLQAIKAAERMAQAHPDASYDLIAQLGPTMVTCGKIAMCLHAPAHHILHDKV